MKNPLVTAFALVTVTFGIRGINIPMDLAPFCMMGLALFMANLVENVSP
jgi:hypothetical protein